MAKWARNAANQYPADQSLPLVHSPPIFRIEIRSSPEYCKNRSVVIPALPLLSTVLLRYTMSLKRCQRFGSVCGKCFFSLRLRPADYVAEPSRSRTKPESMPNSHQPNSKSSSRKRRKMSLIPLPTSHSSKQNSQPGDQEAKSTHRISLLQIKLLHYLIHLLRLLDKNRLAYQVDLSHL